ncbi:hypothetical protein B0H10DRAFT_2197074 [Mycena sp. CBHHK59/15]|nr:hypothetical protein B0H10DRAFT_2197074 [Mycena sp. CBHHK59/15]
MHTSIHSLAHRAPPATRSRVRWQPYNALASSISSRSPSLSYLSTPATTVSSSPPPKATPLCETERLRPVQSSMPETPKDVSNPLRDTPKNKYATGLVDQAVKSLCEIWRPQDIPIVFLTSSRATVGSCSEPLPPTPKSRRRNTQLPSPVSPLTQPSPPTPSSAGSPSYSRTGQTPLQCEQHDLANSFGSRSNLVPIKGFVHEVLRRSRTSGSVLQTALCYLEAIRPKVPELIRKEQAGEGARGEPDLEFRVTPATPAELAQDGEYSLNYDPSRTDRCVDEDVMDTVRVSDENIAMKATPSNSSDEDTPKKPKCASAPLPPLTPLPSPLLCPRRAFLASLILASKFTQDKCYSNRAWAKLSGLPAREIGRCERALGDALDWRLWVGKTPVASPSPASTAPTTVPLGRPVVRCQSESSLNISKGSFLGRCDKKESPNAVPASSPPSVRHRGLRRSSTLPAEAFERPAADRAIRPTMEYGHQLSFSNIAQQDQLMGSPGSSQATMSPSTPSSMFSSQHYPSPIPSTPSLSYSPSSTESSSGDELSLADRTIQMSSFMDDTMAPLAHDVRCGSEMPPNWVAPNSPTLSGIAFEAYVPRLPWVEYNPIWRTCGPGRSRQPTSTRQRTFLVSARQGSGSAPHGALRHPRDARAKQAPSETRDPLFASCPNPNVPRTQDVGPNSFYRRQLPCMRPQQRSVLSVIYYLLCFSRLVHCSISLPASLL